MATDNQDGGEPAGSTFESARKAFAETASGFSGQAGARVRDYTAVGKDRAVEALDNVAGLVNDAATQVSERLGEQYGGYIRHAADAVSNLAGTLRDKDADELIDDARNVIRSSPGVAIAAAAAVGFLMARVVKAGLTPKDGSEEGDGDVEAPVAARKPRAARKTAGEAPAQEAPAAPLADTPIADSPISDSPASGGAAPAA